MDGPLLRKAPLILFIAVFAFAGCKTQQALLTGETLLYTINNQTGEIFDRDVVTSGGHVHKGETIAIIINNIYVKALAERWNPHVLVFAEIYDSGSEDPSSAIRKVIHNGDNTPADITLGASDRILYGPTPFKGFPIRVKFFIVELDKEEKQEASKLINAAGTIAQAAQPQYAAAVGVAVQLAEQINALDQDDFELRFDMTLFPTVPVHRYDIAATNLSALSRPEPVQRQGKDIYLATPLRTGTYLMIKRELPQRGIDKHYKGTGISGHVDFAQEAFYRRRSGYDDEGQRIDDSKTFKVEELIRYHGGYLYRVVNGIEQLRFVTNRIAHGGTNAQNGADQRTEIRRVFQSVAGARVFDPDNPKAGTTLVPGIRLLYRDRTYVTMTLMAGLPEQVDPQILEQNSKRDAATLLKLLDSPARVNDLADVAEGLSTEMNQLVGALWFRQVANKAAKKAGVIPEFRASPAYPAFWAQHLEALDSTDPERVKRATALNQEITETLEEIVINFPVLNSKAANVISCLKTLSASDFEIVSNRTGFFLLRSNSVTRIENCIRTYENKTK
jgi:hypothetical protein